MAKIDYANVKLSSSVPSRRWYTYVDLDAVDPVGVLRGAAAGNVTVELIVILVPGHGVQLVSLQVELAQEFHGLSLQSVLRHRHTHHLQTDSSWNNV